MPVHRGYPARQTGLRRATPGRRVAVLGIGGVVLAGALWWWTLGAGDPLAPAPAPTPKTVPGGGAAGGTGPLVAAPSARPQGATGTADETPEVAVAQRQALEAVRAAVAATTAAPTTRYTLVVSPLDGSPGRGPLLEATGAVDVAAGRVAMVLRTGSGSPDVPPSVLEAIAVPGALFVRSPALDAMGAVPGWWRVPVGADAGGSPAAVSEVVALLGDVVEAEVVGVGTESGVGVTSYRVRLADAVSASVDDAEAGWAQVAVGTDGFIRLVELRAQGAFGAASGQRVAIRLALEGVGEPVVVEVPDAEVVREAAVSAPPNGG